jgi:Protein of unknown function (DUF1553)/Protein of unknown function (DUF1549)
MSGWFPSFFAMVFAGLMSPLALAGEGVPWSLRALVRPPLPGTNAHPVDAFIEAGLVGRRLEAAPAAEARELIRRVSFDLTGLPPSPDEVDAFLPGGYEALVDRLLASPRHGERWARHWLDTIHFADTHGFEHDVFRPNAWRFRDYVIAAFNADTPWPRFIREQLAADVLFPGEPRLTAALGFLGAGPFDASAEGTAQAAYEYAERDDLVTQTMAAFVSTTANCARCHAHKFDPITQEDYFSLQAVFAGVGKGDVAYDEDAAVAAARRRWTAVRDASDAVGPLEPAVLLTAENEALVHAWEDGGGGREAWQPLVLETYTTTLGGTLTRQPDGSLLAGVPFPDTNAYVLTAASPIPSVTALRLELLTDPSLPLMGPGCAANGNLHLTSLEMCVFPAGGAAPVTVKFSKVTADFEQTGYEAAGMIDADPKSSWAIHPRVGEPHYAILTLAEPLALAAGDRLQFNLPQIQPGQHLIGRFRLAVLHGPDRTVAALPAAAQGALAVPRAERTPEQRASLAAPVLAAHAAEALRRLPPQAQVYGAAAANQAARGVILKAAQPRVIRILARGDLDKPGAEAGPGALSAIAALPSRFALADPAQEGLRRAALADWLAHGDNPLTWRSIVNRVWHYHFGKGLCDTPGDFGRMGGVPSHPELIDWLAVWFRDEARGSLKALHRLIVTSAAYRRSSQPAPALMAAGSAVDPDNRLLWRMNRQRLDADSYRDAVMAVSGRLDLTAGGPPVANYLSSPGPQSTPVLDYGAFDWDSPGAARRSIYRVVYRGIADPFMEMLDFPDLGSLAPVRGFSASALQSLTLFNNRFVLTHSKHLAARFAALAPPESVRQMVRHALLREPTAEELTDFTGLAEACGLPAVARLLFNTNEFIFIP